MQILGKYIVDPRTNSDHQCHHRPLRRVVFVFAAKESDDLWWEY